MKNLHSNPFLKAKAGAWRKLRYAFLSLMIASWAVLAIAASHWLDSDGVSYVNIATAVMHGNWQAAVNRYWSPGYPVLFSFWLRVFKPSTYNLIASVRWFDLLWLIVALVSFEWLLRTVMKALEKRATADSESTLSPGPFKALGYVLFFWVTCYLTPPSVNPPDIFVFIALLLAATISLRIAEGSERWLDYAALGIVLGLGYLAKAAMFPLSFVFFGAVALAVRNRRMAPRLLAALLVFLLVSGPFVLALSRKQGHPSFGSTGAINYAIAVDYVQPYGYWRGGKPGNGTPIHPIRQLMDTPPVYEYAMPNGGTLPIWLHHGYWYDGVRPHVILKRQVSVIHISLDEYFKMLGVPLSPLLAGIFFLVLVEGRIPTFGRRFLKELVLWAPAVAGFAMYALVHVEARFLSGFVILLWAAACLSLRLPAWAAGKNVGRSVAWSVIILLGLQIGLAVGHSASRVISGNPFPSWQTAVKLKQAGVEPGDKVCYLGDPVDDDVWALLSGVQIVCNVPRADVLNFWAASEADKRRIVRAFENAGAKAAVGTYVPTAETESGWAQAGRLTVLIRLGGRHPLQFTPTVPLVGTPH